MEKQHPNIVYILTDDLGYGDLSCLNSDSQIHTEQLDEMARCGMRFTDAHATSAVRTPSRYGILTGRYNWRSRLKRGVLNGYAPHLIEPERQTVASFLRGCGYRTACIGKWHLGMDWAKTGDAPEDVDYTAPVRNGPTDCGFERFFGISASLDMPPYVYLENDRVCEPPTRILPASPKPAFWREGPAAEGFRHAEVLPTITRKALELLEEWREDPFFLYLPLPAPHTPILPTERFCGKSGVNAYADFVLMCDDVVGQIRGKLRQLGLEQSTILLFTSDNGCSPAANYPELLSHGHNPSYHFRGHKADIYEGGHRIPLLVEWEGHIAPGSVSDEPVCLSDLFATAADLLDRPLPDNAAEDSVSNLPIWLGRPYSSPLREAIVHHSVEGAFSIRKGKWKLELCPGSGGWSDPKPGQEPAGSPPFQLYDLSADVGERRNVVEEYPDIADSLKQLLVEYIRNGRSTPGAPGQNDCSTPWPQLDWISH